MFMKKFFEILEIMKMKYQFNYFSLNGITCLSKIFPNQFNFIKWKIVLYLLTVFFIKWFHAFIILWEKNIKLYF